MEPYSLGEEGALPSEGHLPSFSESQVLNCSDTLNRDLGPSTRDLLYAGLSGLDLDPSLSTSDMPSEVLEDNLDTLSLYSGKDSDSVKLLEEYADSESQTSLQDLGLGALKVPKEADEGGRATGSTRKGKRQHSSPQNPLLDCSLCGKVFSSASSLSKHYLTHSQERKHVCKVCSKAFKRQDHLYVKNLARRAGGMHLSSYPLPHPSGPLLSSHFCASQMTGHMLTHQKTKPFVCIEQGCSKSYCDYRSLRRHYEVQHGVCILKETPPEEEAYGDPTHNHDVANQPPPSGLRSLGPPEARSPGSVLPNRDLLRCIVSSIVHQKIPSPGPAVGPSDTEARSSACACPTSLGSSSCTPASTPVALGTLGSEIPEETHPPRKEAATEVFTPVQSRAAENGVPDPPESELESESPRLQRPSSLEGWPEGSSLPACLPLFRGHSVPSGSQPSSHNFQWLRNLPGCPKNKGSNVFMVHKPPAVASREGSEGGGSGPSSTPTSVEPSPSLGTTQEELLPFPPALLKAPGEASSEVRQAAGEDETWAPKKCKPDCESFPWQSPTELGLQDAQNPGGLPSDATPLFRQLFMKSQESLVSHEQMQVLQMIAKSQRIFSHTQVATASAQRPGPEGKQSTLKPLQGPWPPQTLPPAPTVDSFQIGPGHSEPEGSPVRRRKTMPAVSRETSPGGPRRDTKGGPKVASAPPSLTGPGLLPSRNPDSSSLAKGTLDLGDIIPNAGSRQSQLGGDEPAGTQLVGKQGQGENGLASGAMRGEKGPACPRGGGYRLFSGHPRAQRFSGFRKEEVKMDVCCAASPSQVAMASFSSAGPLADPPRDMKSKLTIFNRIQISSHLQGGNIYRLPHPVKEESLAGGCHQPNGGPTDWMESKSTFVCKNCSQMFYTEKGLSSHMCFHSDQWPSPRGKQEQQGQEKDGEERDSKESCQYRKRKKRPQPKALFAPPAPSALGEPGPGGCHQSCLHSPVFLVDHLLKGLFQCSPYTPPPMLSPIREGSGLYFNTLCSTSRAGPHLISPVLDPD